MYSVTSINDLTASDNLQFRFATDGEGNYGYLGADDSFIPFKSGDSDGLELYTFATFYQSGAYASYNIDENTYSFECSSTSSNGIHIYRNINCSLYNSVTVKYTLTSGDNMGSTLQNFNICDGVNTGSYMPVNIHVMQPLDYTIGDHTITLDISDLSGVLVLDFFPIRLTGTITNIIAL